MLEEQMDLTLICQRCGSGSIEYRPHDLHGVGAWCRECGRWIKWMGKKFKSQCIKEADRT